MPFFEWPLKTGFTVYNKVKWVSNLRFLVKKVSIRPTHTGKTGLGKEKQKYFEGWPKAK